MPGIGQRKFRGGRSVRMRTVAPSAMTLGFHAHSYANIPAATQAGYGAIRLWDTGTDWRSLQSARGVWDFVKLDAYVAASELAGLKVMLNLGLSPVWASARPTETAIYGPGSAAEPADIQDWRTYVRTVAERYRGRIGAYEVWNEVTFPTDPALAPGDRGGAGMFFSGTAQALVNLAQAAYQEIKAADPAAVVLAPSFHPASGNWGAQFNLYLSLGGKLYADAIAQHFYFANEPEQTAPTIVAMRNFMTNNGVGHLPIWDTEVGVGFGGELSQWPSLTPEQLVYALTLRTYLVNAANGVKRVNWYAWDNNGFGFGASGLDKDKAVAAASAAIRFFNGMWFATTKSTGNLWECSIGTQGTRYKVVWLSGVNPTPQAYTVQRPATRWGIPVETFAAGAQIMLDARPVIIDDAKF